MHPMQEIHRADDGVIRFRKNAIICYLFDAGLLDLNKIATMGFSAEDQCQIAQQLGYSVSGFGDLDYVPAEMVAWCDYLAEQVADDQSR